MTEHDYEPIPGLPENLPQGEVILWQGSPDWQTLARRVFHLRMLAVYFVLLLALRGATLWAGTGDLLAAAASVGRLTVLALCAGGLFVLFAKLMARSTLYTITNRRLVMRFGVALPMSVNLPFPRIQAAAVKRFSDGHGDIPVTLDETHRVSYLVMWPHVRPWRMGRPQPMLRAIPDAESVAAILARAVDASPVEDTSPQPARTARPVAPADHAAARVRVNETAMGEMS